MPLDLDLPYWSVNLKKKEYGMFGVEWTNLPKGTAYWHRRANRDGVFPKSEVKIIRCKTKLERQIIKFFKTLFHKTLKILKK